MSQKEEENLKRAFRKTFMHMNFEKFTSDKGLVEEQNENII
jgi:hypothetical protein